MRHYRNLWRTRWRFEQYLNRYRFVSVGEHLGLPATKPHQPVKPRVDSRPIAEITVGEPKRSAKVQKVSVIVPMYNEQDNIPYLLRTLSTVAARTYDRYELELVFVDDCSRDDTWGVLQRASEGRDDIKLVRHEKNMGVAAALMTGARAASADIVCSIDCDCSYDPMDLQEMVPLLSDADMVTASPYHPLGQVLNVPRWRLFLSRGLSMLYRRTLRADLYTWTSCFRVWRRDKLAEIELEHKDFLGVAEMVVRLLRRGGTVREFPTMLESRLLGTSKMKTLKTILGHLGLLWQVVRRRIS